MAAVIDRVDPGEPGIVPALAGILLDCVLGGASVSFMSDLTRADAESFWWRVMGEVEHGDSIVLVARDPRPVGTVTVKFGMPPNQPHRAEIAKMLVAGAARGGGVGTALITAAEAEVAAAGRALIVLDTCAGGAGERLYRRAGYREAGRIPGYALMPFGGWCDTVIFYKQLAPPTAPFPRS